MDEPLPDISITVTEEFVEGTLQITSDRVYNDLFDIIGKLATIPEFGSKNVPPSMADRYGEKARKIVIPPFDAFYTYDAKTGTVKVLVLVHQRRAR